jgi:hypothetical protein
MSARELKSLAWAPCLEWKNRSGRADQEEKKQDQNLTQRRELAKKNRQRTETLTRWPELSKKNSQHRNLLDERNEIKQRNLVL